MASSPPAGRTRLSIDFAALASTSARMDDVSRSASQVNTTMTRSSISATSFGLLNVPLGGAVSALASQAKSLTQDLDVLAHRLSINTRTLEKSWRAAEEDIRDNIAKTQEKIDDPNSVEDSCGPGDKRPDPRGSGAPRSGDGQRPEGGAPAWQAARWDERGEDTVFV